MSNRKMVIVGNWKMNKTIAEAKKFFADFKKEYVKEKAKIDVKTKFGFAVPSVVLQVAKEKKVHPRMIVSSQNIHQQDTGAFTGELSARMVKEAGANAVVIGHSERRQYFGETNADVNEKLLFALETKLLPIVCVGETLEERKSKKWKAIIRKQIKDAFKNVVETDASKVIIAYEPIWAIGTGVTASSIEAQEACSFVRNEISKIYSSEIAKKIIIQYGGSVKPTNISELMNQNDIDGALVGGASLDSKTFIKLLTLNK